MSKSFGNTIDPHKCLDMVPSDTFRYYLIRETPYGADMSFSEDAMKLVHNSDLADSLGNLFSRAVAMCAKYTGGKVPEEKSEGSFNLEKTIKTVEKVMGSYELHKMAEACILSVHDVNKYLTDREPWKMKDEKKRASVVRTILESCYYFAHLFAPMCPLAAENMMKTLNVEMRPLKELSIGFDNLSSGQSVGKATVLFPKLIDEDKNKKAKAAATKGGKKKGNKGGGKRKRLNLIRIRMSSHKLTFELGKSSKCGNTRVVTSYSARRLMLEKISQGKLQAGYELTINWMICRVEKYWWFAI